MKVPGEDMACLLMELQIRLSGKGEHLNEN
jgi:hypothetical protein